MGSPSSLSSRVVHKDEDQKKIQKKNQKESRFALLRMGVQSLEKGDVC